MSSVARNKWTGTKTAVGPKSSEKRRKVFLLNNYDMAIASKRVSSGEYPAQHLWGMSALPEHWEWRCATVSTSWVMSRLRIPGPAQRAITGVIGDPIQCLQFLFSDCDVAYAADQQSSVLLGFMRRFKIIRRRLVVVVHNGPRTRWSFEWMKGADELIVLVDRVRDRLLSGQLDPKRIHLGPWGPDHQSSIYSGLSNNDVGQTGVPTKLNDFFAGGKTNRDYSQLSQWAKEMKKTGSIYDGRTLSRFRDGNCETLECALSYRQILEGMSASKVVCITLDDVDRMSGLTEVSDAMALGVPIIATRTALFQFDIEQRKIGAWIEHSSVRAIEQAYNTALENSDQQAFDELLQKYSIASYAEVLQALLVGQHEK